MTLQDVLPYTETTMQILGAVYLLLLLGSIPRKKAYEQSAFRVEYVVLSPAQWQELAAEIGLGECGLDSIYCGQCSGLKKFGDHCSACLEEIE